MIQRGKMHRHELHLFFAQDRRGVARALLVAIESRVEIGRVRAGLFLDFIDQSGGRYNCRIAQAAMANFAAPILSLSQRPALKWEIVVVENETVNAWALPGGKLAVHKGLLERSLERC